MQKETIANVILRVAKRRIVPSVFFIQLPFSVSHQMGRWASHHDLILGHFL
jgi:hypothetical protein